ncbi:copper uptake system-associated protein [Duganella sp. FT3S]|uniref:Copper uptake system-associated protein n=1 Tax=Rugamonas fusca TaxID=2758568 RepID=A0A7W2I5F9_9BURK|nr:copper uptake system-associated protein [Rugamonas fusca]MBA5604235.1 copper uptake system-associated protein [Rugamonas fusca]
MKRMKLHCLMAALLMGGSLAAASAQDAEHAARIKSLIGKTYDRPDHKVETAPVVVVGEHALADWVQGEKGGRALLRRNQGDWTIVACGGDGFKDVKLLQDAGIPADAAKRLVARLNEAEQSLSPARVKRFGLYGTANDPRAAEHHDHSHHSMQH